MNQWAWEKMLDEDIAWLEAQPRTLEREHVICCMKWLRGNRPDRPLRIMFEFDERSLDTLEQIKARAGIEFSEITVRNPTTGEERIMIIPDVPERSA